MPVLVGRVMTEVTCPVCNCIWLLDTGEYQRHYYKNDKGEELIDSIDFFCPECSQQINAPMCNCRTVDYRLKKPKELKDKLFYNYIL